MLNKKDPNSTDDIEKLSRSIDDIINSLQTPGSIQEILNVGGTIFGRKDRVQVRPLLKNLVDQVDVPILKDMARDVVTVLSNWFEDPRTLCCLIQGLFTAYNATSDRISFENTDFAKWLDILIAFVDIIIVLLASEIKKLAFAIPDFITEISNSTIGALLLILQETLFSLRDSLINYLLQVIDDAKDKFWVKCLPFVELVEVIKKYISDYGYLSELFEKTKAFIGQKVGHFGYMKALDFPKNVKDLEFLYWFRDLLVKLKTAAISFDLCFLVQPGTTDSEKQQIVGDILGKEEEIETALGKKPKPTINPEIQGISIASDGTILQDKETITKSTLPILTNSSIRAFLNKYYGYPLDVIDNMLIGPTSADSVRGTDTKSPNGDLYNADCPNSPDPYEAIRWALRVRNRNL